MKSKQVLLAAGVAVMMTFSMESSAARATSATAPARVAGFSFVKSLGGIEEYRLDANGLTVLIVPDHSLPIASLNVTYRVGSRNEVTGTTGATHLLEHLMFKGTDAFNRKRGNSLDQQLERLGAGYNATTWFDRTNYYATLDAASLAQYIPIEADRMRNLWLREEDRQAEMTVVRNEYERGKNDPRSLLEESVFATAYQALPYHHSTIGWKSDIERVPIEKLREFYDTFYWPNNVTVTVAGDVAAAELLPLIAKSFAAIPRSPREIPKIYTEEPEQLGARRVVIKRPGELGSLVVAHKSPSARSPDQAALAVMDSILSSGKTSRLYRSLVDRQLALSVNAQTYRLHDPSLHLVQVELAPDATPDAVERSLLEEIDKLKKQGVTAGEVNRAKRSLQADLAYARDGAESVAAELNEWIGAGDWTLYVSFPQAIQKVTAADVQRVARTYLLEDLSTTGWFVPVSGN